MKMRDRLRDYLSTANESERTHKSKEKVYYDRNCRMRKFKSGDKVLLLLPTAAVPMGRAMRMPLFMVFPHFLNCSSSPLDFTLRVLLLLWILRLKLTTIIVIIMAMQESK